MLGLPWQGVRPLPGTLAGMGKPGCRWPRWYPGTGRPHVHGGGRRGVEGPGKPGDQGQSAAVLKEAEAQSFQLYHPQVDQAIRKKGLAGASGTEFGGGLTEEMLDNEMAILAPLQEGMQALPSEEVAKGVDASQALAEAMGSIQRQTSEPRTLTRHGCSTTLSSPWKCQALERGLFCPLVPEDICQVGDIKEKYVPYIRMLRASQNPWQGPIWCTGLGARPGL